MWWPPPKTPELRRINDVHVHTYIYIHSTAKQSHTKILLNFDHHDKWREGFEHGASITSPLVTWCFGWSERRPFEKLLLRPLYFGGFLDTAAHLRDGVNKSRSIPFLMLGYIHWPFLPLWCDKQGLHIMMTGSLPRRLHCFKTVDAFREAVSSKPVDWTRCAGVRCILRILSQMSFYVWWIDKWFSDLQGPRCFPIARAGLADKTPPVHTGVFLFVIEPERSWPFTFPRYRSCVWQVWNVQEAW